MILGPVAAELVAKRLIIVPDGILNYVPFAALPVPPVGTPVPARQLKLVDEHEIVYLSLGFDPWLKESGATANHVDSGCQPTVASVGGNIFRSPKFSNRKVNYGL